MERIKRVKIDEIYLRGLDQFAVQTIQKSFYTTNEYLVNGEWQTGKPIAKPDKKRVIFEGNFIMDGLERYEMAKGTYKSWELLTRDNIYDAVGKEEILKRLIEPLGFKINSRLVGWSSEKSITTLFVPWGVRPQGEFGEPEKAVLNRIKALQDGIQQNGIPAKGLIMPADLYATEVNQQIDSKRASDYFARVTEAAKERDLQVIPWSELRQTYLRFPDGKARYEGLTEVELRKILPEAIFKTAFKAASRRSGADTDSEIQAAAIRYLRERVFEAEMIDKEYRPIKVSAVAKNKDNYVDRNLPRVYVIPQELQFPWLK